jgi:hypothetical protein
VGVIGSSLVMLLLVPGRHIRSPVQSWAVLILAWVGLEVYHPQTSTAVAGACHFLFYLAVLGPVFWVCRLAVTPELLRRLLLTLWGFHLIGATVGILQVYYPGRFQPAMSSVVLAIDEGVQESLKIQLSSGESIWRPMGLSDSPGGACIAGLYCCVFGMGFFVFAKGMMRWTALASIGIGLFCVYLSQVRSILVMIGVCALVEASVLFCLGELRRFFLVMLVVPAVAIGSFLWAVTVADEAVIQRFTTLIAERPDQVYYSNRGFFLEDTLQNLLPQYPLGAGLGRWGMMNYYFGDNSNPSRPPLWAEIQLTGWLFDGGLLLILFYSAALLVTTRFAWKVAMWKGQRTLRRTAVMILSYDVAVAAVTFNYPIFMSQGGLEFWLLNSCLFVAVAYERRSRTAERRRVQPDLSAAGRRTGCPSTS